jgi:hypothetical protein
MIKFIFRAIFIFILPRLSLAANGAGDIASNLMEPVTVLTSFVSAGSISVGIAFIVASILKYMQYRVNPLATPLSTVILLLAMGLVLVFLPWAYMLTENGVVPTILKK